MKILFYFDINFIDFPEPENNWQYLHDEQIISIEPIDVHILGFKEIYFNFYKN